MEKFTITITRQFGSLGRSIAKELSELLQVEFYDRDIVEEVSNQLNLPLSKVSDSEERVDHPLWTHMFPLGTDEAYMQDLIFQAQKEIILDWAEKSSCIFVGRCADYLLEEKKNNLNIYIYAAYEQRLKNCTNVLQMSEGQAKKMIASVDKARVAYHKRYAGFLPNDTAHKHFLIDSSVLGVTGTAKLIEGITRELYK